MAYTLDDIREAVNNREAAAQAELDRIRKDKEEFIKNRITSISDVTHEILMCKGGLGEVYRVEELDEGTFFNNLVETYKKEMGFEEAYATGPIVIEGSSDYSEFLGKHTKEIFAEFGKVEGWGGFTFIPTEVKHRQSEQDGVLTELWRKNVMGFPFDYNDFNCGRAPNGVVPLTVRLVVFAKKTEGGLLEAA